MIRKPNDKHLPLAPQDISHNQENEILETHASRQRAETRELQWRAFTGTTDHQWDAFDRAEFEYFEEGREGSDDKETDDSETESDTASDIENGGQSGTAPQDTSNNLMNYTKEGQKDQPEGSFSHLLDKQKPLLIPPTAEEWKREAMLVYQNDFHPIPKGKSQQCKAALYTPGKDGVRPIKGEVEYTDEFMASQRFPHGYCIGTDNMAFLDCDSPNRELAEHMVNYVIPKLTGKVILRVGKSPKFSIAVRTSSQEKDSTPAFNDENGTKNQFEILAGKGQHSAVAGTSDIYGGRYQITTENDFTNTKLEELPPVDSALIEIFKAEFVRKCQELGMKTEEGEVPSPKDLEVVKPPPESTKRAARSIQGDIYAKVSMYTDLDAAASELEELDWPIFEGIQPNGHYPTITSEGKTYDCIKLTRPGKDGGVSASLINFDDGVVLYNFSTSVPNLRVGPHKFAEAIKILKHDGDSQSAMKDFVGRFGSHPFFKKNQDQALLERMQFGGKANTSLLMDLKKILKSKESINAALDWFDMDFKHDDLDKIFKNSGLKIYSCQEFVDMDIPETACVLSPILEEGGITLVTARTGIGKSHFALDCALAAASGGIFLKYQAPKPTNVVYVDGEMSSHDIQARMRKAINRLPDNKRRLALNNLHIISASEQELAIPCLSTKEGQEAVEECITTDHTLLILDNVSTLIRNGSENDDANWIPVQEWLVQIRKRGITVLLIHHEGKGEGGQRGTTKRVDIVNTHIQLTRPKDYEDGQGARFEVRILKGRSISGEDSLPFEAWLKDDRWEDRKIDQGTYESVVALLKNSENVSDIAEALDISKSYTSRLAKKAMKEGLIANVNKGKPGRKSGGGN